MTETTEQRIERVARAIFDSAGLYAAPERKSKPWDRAPDLHQKYLTIARAADAISFAAAWDAAVEVLQERSAGGGASHPMRIAADYLAAHRPGEPT